MLEQQACINISHGERVGASGKKYTPSGQRDGKGEQGDRAADDKITLCAGARRHVALVNDPEGKYVNGSQGNGREMHQDERRSPLMPNPDELVKIEAHTWKILKSVVEEFVDPGQNEKQSDF